VASGGGWGGGNLSLGFLGEIIRLALSAAIFPRLLLLLLHHRHPTTFPSPPPRHGGSNSIQVDGFRARCAETVWIVCRMNANCEGNLQHRQFT